MASSARPPTRSLIPPLPWLDPFLPPTLRVAPGADAAGPPSARDVRRARVVVVEALLSATALVAVSAALALGRYPVVNVVQALGASLLPLAALALVRWGGRVDAAAAAVAAALVTTPLVQAILDYGVTDPALALMAVAPLAAAMASGLRLALVTLAVGVLGAGTLLAMHLGGYPFPMVAPEAALLWWAFLVVAGGSVMSLLAGVLYVRHSEAALTLVETEAVRLRGSLDESEARYRSLVERMPVGMYRIAPDGRLLLANPALATVLGMASRDDAPPASVLAVLETAIARASREGTAEVDLPRPAGGTRRVRLDGRAVRTADGTLLYHEGTLEDVTDAHAARASLERSEARFRALVQRSSDVTLVVSRDSRITYASPAIEHLLGVSAPDVVGRVVWEWVHETDLDDVRGAVEAMSRAPGIVRTGALRLRRADGAFVYADGVAAALFDDPAVAGLVVNLRDATERRRAQAVLVRAKQHAEEVAQMKSAFLASMSHEIRTPLTSILGYADVLADEVTEPDHREFVDLIAQGGRRLMDTLNSVLDLARFEAGRGDLALEPMRVANAVGEAVRLMQPDARRRGVALLASISAPDAHAELDDAAFARVLHNLVGNALKFTPEGGSVTVSVAADAHRVSVEVRDTGIGIAPEFVPRLFTEFEQASSGVSRTHEGAGLGLSIVRQLVERMGGTIAVESEMGTGSAFLVSFPRLGAEVPPADERPLALVVDDNEQARLVTSRVLEGRFRVVRAATGEEALEIAARQPPDLAVLDIHLGAGADGTEVMRRLRAMDGLAHLPIVAVTAFGLLGDRPRYLAMGFDEFVTKPFTRDDLLAAVATACRRDGATAVAA